MTDINQIISTIKETLKDEGVEKVMFYQEIYSKGRILYA